MSSFYSGTTVINTHNCKWLVIRDWSSHRNMLSGIYTDWEPQFATDFRDFGILQTVNLRRWWGIFWSIFWSLPRHSQWQVSSKHNTKPYCNLHCATGYSPPMAWCSRVIVALCVPMCPVVCLVCFFHVFTSSSFKPCCPDNNWKLKWS